MPHKHTRKVRDEATFDLPPTQYAKALPVSQTSRKKDASRKDKSAHAPANTNTKNLKRKRDAAPKNDAPRAFKRLMAFAHGKKPRSGLDNGDQPRTAKGKKRDSAQQADSSKSAPKPATKIPTIRPGERMAEFSARVDAALPLAGLINKSVNGSNKDPLGLKKYRTLKEKKMHKMYDEWREQDRKVKERREEEREQQEEKDLEDEENGVSWKLHTQDQASGKRKKGALKDEEDPWDALRKKRGEVRPGLHDVALAPPSFTTRPSKQLLVRGAAVQVQDIPKSAGSLKRREELQVARSDIVAAYRKAMSQKRSTQKES
ncbi:hypothetical protein GGR57DRAFT_200345 [Xylariaceae sp. FL1272]|nr:hypothetical protein GGR57DRAFT_200345 [Xylariaceae sp. FL1272]